MEGIVCDRCGEGLLIHENVRYVLNLEMFAAYDPMEITANDLDRDLEKEIGETLRTIEEIPEASPPSKRDPRESWLSGRICAHR